MVPQDVIEVAGRKLAAAAKNPVKVVLFGSHARGDAGPDSDLDFLVVERDLGDRHAEMVRLGRELRPLGIPVDVVVVSERYAEDWEGVEGSMVHAALTEGRVLHAAAWPTRSGAGAAREGDRRRDACTEGFSDTDIADAIVGFHAQQAVEKLIKAVLAARGVVFIKSHALGYLIGVVEENEIEAPQELSEADVLSPWAVEFRYEGDEPPALDRPAALTLVEQVRAWAENEIEAVDRSLQAEQQQPQPGDSRPESPI
jgi:uncharacterized protein